MNPKKPCDIYPLVIERTGAQKKLVEDIVSFYWKEVRNAIINGKSHNIFIDGLGTFKLKSWKLPEVISKHEVIIQRYKNLINGENKMTIQKFAILKEYEDRLEKLYGLQKMIDADKEKKEQVKQKRYAQKVKNNLEEPSPDMGRLQEPDIQD